MSIIDPHVAFLRTPRRRLPGLDAPISTILKDSATSTVQTRAVEKFNCEISESSRLHLDEKTTFKDVLSELQSILNDVRVRRSPLHSKVNQVLRRLNNLAVVGDVMSQYDSHNASLAWGGFRLLLHLGLEQFEMLDRIIDSFDQIFLLIGRVQLYDTMFGTNRLQLGIETLYQHIIDFTQRAIRYLKKGRLGRLGASLWSPYQAEFQEVYMKIKAFADLVEKEASLAHMCASDEQIRDIQCRLKQLTSTADTMLKQVNDLRSYQISAQCFREDCLNGERVQLARKLTKIIAATDFVDNAVTLLFTSRKYLPEDGCRWILSNPIFLRWKNTSEPNFLALTGGRGTGKFILASFISTHLLEDPQIGKRVIWFYSVLWEEESLTPALILRCLIAQLLQKHPDVLARQSPPYYKKRFKAAKGLKELYTLFVDIVSKVGKIFIVIDALDSCPNNATLAENLIQLCESRLPVKILITAMEDPNLGPVLHDAAKIRLQPGNVSSDVSQYVTSQLSTNMPQLKNVHSELATTVITGAAGNIGWARYIIWGLSLAENEEGIEFWRKTAAKGRDVIYGRQFDDLAKSLPSTQLRLIKVILRALLIEEKGLSVDEAYQVITTRNSESPVVLLNTFDEHAWDQTAIQSSLSLLESLRTPFVSCADARYTIANVPLREYLFNHTPSQRPLVPHLWLPTDTCMLQCQLRHRSHSQQYEDGTLEHMKADFKDFAAEPGQFVQ